LCVCHGSTSYALVWSALGGELKPSLDVVVTAPIVISSSSYFGPPVMAGPTIGLSAAGGPSEESSGRGRKRPAAPELEPLPEEIVPRGAESGRKGVTLRVRGHRK